jgi:glycolate oxidase iron-sulfur subunit
MAQPHLVPASELARGNSAFDSHHPPRQEFINDCVHCGFCLQTCPTYALWAQEMDSPRGRIYLMNSGLNGTIPEMTPAFVKHFDTCLGCMACMTACPSGVRYEPLIEATRAQIERNYKRSLGDRLHRWMIFQIFPHPNRLKAMLPLLWFYQRSGLQTLLQKTHALDPLPTGIRAMESLLPEVSLEREEVPEFISAKGAKRMRVGMLLGCVQRVFFDDVNAATARVLAAEGCEVLIPREQSCCGALMTHAGREKEAQDAARKLIDIFEPLNIDAFVINAAGCGSNLKSMAWLLRDDAQYAERAKSFAAKCRDISEVLNDLEPRAKYGPLPIKVAYQDACHLNHAQGIKAEPRAVLGRIPQLELVDVPEAAICCGSAGIYNMVEPVAAAQLGDRKAQHVYSTGASVVVSGNPGCLLQMKNAFRRLGREIPAMHFVQLLDAAMLGISAERLTRVTSEKLTRAA